MHPTLRKATTSSFLPALLCGAALFTFACDRGEQTPTGQVSNPAPLQVAQTRTPPAAPAPSVEPQINEFQPRSVPVPQPALPPTRHRAVPRPAPAPRRSEPVEALPAPAPEPDPAVFPVPAAAEPAPLPEIPREEPRSTATTTTVTVPAGTRLDAEFTRTVASNTSSPGDSFRARVSEDVIEDGVVVIPRGSEILGEVTDAVPLKRVGGQARLALKFTDLVLPSGKTVPIGASFVQEGRNETRRDAATIGGAAAGGAILGRILSQGSRSRGSVLGALLGAAAGTAIASKTPGEEVIIPEGSVVTLRLDGPVRVRVKALR